MRLSTDLDLDRPGRAAAVVAATAAIVCAILFVHMGLKVGPNLGDTDDATRLVIVRDLMHGRGWFDQRLTRFQPPEGVWLHWSRLLDGGLALMERGYGLFVGPVRAEWLTRATWPLIWVTVGLAGVLGGARRLAGPTNTRDPVLASAALLAGAMICVVDLVLYYAQFHPGRIDHHDAQIALCVVAATAAMQCGERRAGAAICGLATGLGLAVGLEAIVFEAVLAIAFALRWLGDRREASRTATYATALAVTTLVVFCVQTPPARWFLSACDALAINLLAAILGGGGVLAGLALATRRRAWGWRLAALALAAAITVTLYAGLEPRCLHGPFADVDPRIRPFWLDHVQEMKPFPLLWKTSRPDAVDIAVFGVMGLAAWAAIGLERARRRDPAWMIQGAMLALGAAFAFAAVRSRAYVEWFSVAPLAVAAAEIGRRLGRLVSPLVGGAVAGVALSPVIATGAVLLLLAAPVGRHKPTARPAAPPDHCFDAAAYDKLATLPAGVVASEVDLGPFVLAHTPHSALSGPYHRMTLGILRARSVVAASAEDAGPAGSAARARAVGADYVLECRAHARHADRSGLKPGALQIRLDRGLAPNWLTPLSPKDAPLQIYAVAAHPPPPPASPRVFSSPAAQAAGEVARRAAP